MDCVEASRSFVQKAVVAVCRRPIYGAVHSILEYYSHAYFMMGLFSDRTILESFFKTINNRLGTITTQNREILLFQGRSFVSRCLIPRHRPPRPAGEAQ